eukprot:11511169-Alexandrium_andersonii.AAC.1
MASSGRAPTVVASSTAAGVPPPAPTCAKRTRAPSTSCKVAARPTSPAARPTLARSRLSSDGR